jgi:hypothetical protein
MQKAANIFVKKTYQNKHNVVDDQIARQQLQMSNLLIVELTLRDTHCDIVVRK